MFWIWMVIVPILVWLVLLTGITVLLVRSWLEESEDLERDRKLLADLVAKQQSLISRLKVQDYASKDYQDAAEMISDNKNPR